MAYCSAVQPTFLCCDIISRLREDINCLCSDTKILVQMQTSYENQLSKFGTLTSEMEEKLKNIPSAKLVNFNGHEQTAIEYKTSEFVKFIKLVWKFASQILEKSYRSQKFFSSRGTPITSYLEKLMILTDFIQKYYYSDFIHPECAMLFTHLCKQLRFLLAPELVRGDHLEGALKYIDAAIPTIINIFTVIDLFISTPRYSDITVLCREVIDGDIEYQQNDISAELSDEVIPLKYLCAMLTGELFGYEPLTDMTPIVESKIKRFYEMASEMAQYLIRISEPAKTSHSQQNACTLMRPGCLDPAFYESLPPLVKKTVAQSKSTTRGRGRPRRPSRIKETLISPAPYG